MTKPNIVIFNPDQFRKDSLSHMGNKSSQTPNLDAICKTDGVSFANAFCQNPVCTPSRCSFMTGWYPHTFGHRTMHHMLNKNEPVLLKTLKDNGYFVWWGGKNDLVPADADMSMYCDVKYENSNDIVEGLHSNQSWRQRDDEQGYYSMYAGELEKKNGVYNDSDWDDVNGATEFIKNYDSDKPMCMFLALQYPHPPYGVEKPFYDNVNKDNIDMISCSQVDFFNKPSIINGIMKNQNLHNFSDIEFKEIKRTYYGMCNRIDYLFGLVVQSLKEKGMYENTLIVVLSDHGDFTGDYGLVEKTQNTFEDCLVNVPLIIKPPKSSGVTPHINKSLVELVDVVPTICEYAQIDLDYYQFGLSLAYIIKGDANSHREYVCCEGGRLKDESHCKEVLPDKLDKKSLYYPRMVCQSTNDVMHTKAVMIRNYNFKYVYRLYEQDEFYDLNKDKNETLNVINDKNYQQDVLEFKQRLLEFLVSTVDTVPFKQDLRF